MSKKASDRAPSRDLWRDISVSEWRVSVSGRIDKYRGLHIHGLDLAIGLGQLGIVHIPSSK